MPDAVLSLPTWGWVILALIAGACVLSMLHTLACAARNEIQIHTLKLETLRLRQAYIARLRSRSAHPDLADEPVMEVGPADEEDAPADGAAPPVEPVTSAAA